MSGIKINIENDDQSLVEKIKSAGLVRLLRLEVTKENLGDFISALKHDNLNNIQVMLRFKANHHDLLLKVLEGLSENRFKFVVKNYYEADRNQNYIIQKRNFSMLSVFAQK